MLAVGGKDVGIAEPTVFHEAAVRSCESISQLPVSLLASRQSTRHWAANGDFQSRPMTLPACPLPHVAGVPEALALDTATQILPPGP